MVLIDDLQHRSVRQAGCCNCSTVLRAMKHSHDFQQLYSFPVCGRCVIQLRARGEQFSTVNTVKHAVNYYSQHAAAAAPTPAVAATAIGCRSMRINKAAIVFATAVADLRLRFTVPVNWNQVLEWENRDPTIGT